jgi:lipoprotein-anchoring transpeptidase ErfK/SrfK
MNSDIWIKIIKSMFELNVYDADKLMLTFSVAIGENPGVKQSIGDKRTPEGTFYIVNIEDASKWEHDFMDGKGILSNAYGPWFIRLSTTSKETKSGQTWTGIGIHGTHNPGSIGTKCTEGCIRMLNEDLLKVVQMVKVGTKVQIIE